ncbi:MAG: zf-HC2 domain-containing protein [Actinomycetota bacterium]
MSLSCDDLDAMLPEFLDGSTTPDQESAAAEHLATCAACTAELGELQGVTKLYREHGTLRLPEESRKRIAETLGIDE